MTVDDHVGELAMSLMSGVKEAALTSLDHCIDSLRQLIMCRGDVAVQTYTWRPDLLIPWANFEVAHECIDFEAVDNWAEKRAIDIRNPNYLVHPTLGEYFLHGSCPCHFPSNML